MGAFARPKPRDSTPLEPDQNDGTRVFYERNADRYAALTLNAKLGSLHEEFVKKVRPNSLVLDLGCGAGRDTGRLLEAGYRMVGLDYAAALLRIAARVSQGKFVLGDMRLLPFRHRSFDAVWAVASLLHIPKHEIEDVLRDLADLVVHRGLMFVSVKVGTGEVVDADGRFFAFYSESEWVDCLKRSGWRVVSLATEIERRSDSDVEWLLSVSTR